MDDATYWKLMKKDLEEQLRAEMKAHIQRLEDHINEYLTHVYPNEIRKELGL